MAARSSPAASASIKRFTVRRRPAMLVTPASPTPRELKRLSDVDGRGNVRLQIPIIYFYQSKEASMADKKDPVVVIRDAVAGALVPYYPFAGRLREEHDDDGGGSNRLAVDCTGEGVLFVEADADVRLEQFFGDGDDGPLLPPFPCVEELIFDVPGSSAILNTPLLLFQVTRLACGGFVMALRLNHAMADALGLAQFLGAVAELARGEVVPTVQPVWERHLLDGHGRPPRHEAVAVAVADDSSSSIMLSLLSPEDMALHYFFFGPREIAAIRAQLPPELQSRASRFDVMAGWLWKCRTMALASPDSDEVMLMEFVVNARGRRSSSSSGIPTGYYGNALAATIAISTAGELCANPVSHAVGLVKEAKDKVDLEYVRSAAPPGRRRIQAGGYALVDEIKARFDDVDLGWGRPLYAGPVQPSGFPDVPWAESYVLSFKNDANNNGDDGGAVVPVFLPRPAMDRLVHEMGKLRPQPADDGFPAVIKRSAL